MENSKKNSLEKGKSVFKWHKWQRIYKNFIGIIAFVYEL